MLFPYQSTTLHPTIPLSSSFSYSLGVCLGDTGALEYQASVSVMPNITQEVGGILGEEPLPEPGHPHYPFPWVHRLQPPHTQLTTWCQYIHASAPFACRWLSPLGTWLVTSWRCPEWGPEMLLPSGRPPGAGPVWPWLGTGCAVCGSGHVQKPAGGSWGPGHPGGCSSFPDRQRVLGALTLRPPAELEEGSETQSEKCLATPKMGMGSHQTPCPRDYDGEEQRYSPCSSAVMGWKISPNPFSSSRSAAKPVAAS